MFRDPYFGPQITDRLRFMAARAVAWVTRNATAWVPATGRLASFPSGARATVLAALAEARTAQGVKELLQQEKALTPEFLQDVARRCGAITPSLARWLATVQPITAEGLAANPQLSAPASQAAARVLQQRLRARSTNVSGWARVFEALLAMEHQRPGTITWNDSMRREVRLHLDAVNVQPRLWLKLAACERAPTDLVDRTWPSYVLSSILANVDLLVQLLTHPRAPRTMPAVVLRRLRQRTFDRNLVVAVVRAAEGAQRSPWWHAALDVYPAFTLQVLAEERGQVDEGRALDGIFTHEEIAAYLVHEDAQARLAAICLLQHVRPAVERSDVSPDAPPDALSDAPSRRGPVIGDAEAIRRQGRRSLR